MQMAAFPLFATLLVLLTACGSGHTGSTASDDACSSEDNFCCGGCDGVSIGRPIDAGVRLDASLFLDANIPKYTPDSARPQLGDASLVSFTPEDNTTNVGSGALGLSVLAHSADSTLDDVLDGLSDALEIVHWPSAQQVSAHVSRTDASVPKLVIVPDAPLSSGWYALRLDVPDGTVAVPQVGAERLQGLYTSRFRVDSAPVVQRIELCHDDTSYYDGKLNVYFSESVNSVLDSDAVIIETVQPTDHPNTLPDVSCKLLRGLGGNQLQFFCTNLFTGPLDVALHEFTSTTGVQLQDLSGAVPEYSIDPNTLPVVDVCNVFVPWR